MKGIYLCAKQHRLPGYDMDYNDIFPYPGINKVCSCEEINLNKYDYIIATPPCNYYSRANWRRETSKVAQQTKHLLPYCLNECIKSNKPFIVENVNNKTLLPRATCYTFNYGGHTFYTNVPFSIPPGQIPERQNKQYLTRSKRDGNINVDTIIKLFLRHIHLDNWLMEVRK